MVKLITFDLDGTLLDTIEDLANSVNYALSCNGFSEHSLDKYPFFVGNGLNKLLERALPDDKRSPEMLAKMKADFLNHYGQHSEDMTKPYPGISELVSRLYTEGYLLAVASNKIHQATVELVERFFPNVRFTAVFGQREGHPVKPDPLILDDIIEIAGVERSEVLYVGDSGVDAQTAINAGVEFVAVLWGFRTIEELKENGAKQFASTADELYGLIRKQ